MLIYAIKSITYLSIMYIPYMLLLRKESFFRFNRCMLLIIMLSSLVLPLINVQSLAISNNPLTPIMQPHVEIGMPVIQDANATLPATQSQSPWILVAQYIYIIGAIITLLFKWVQVVFLYKVMYRGKLWTIKRNGVRIICQKRNVAPFSWFRTIVISQEDYNNNASEIIAHEMGHIRHYHSWDIMLLNIVQTLQWLNPLAWIMGSSLRDVHEYEADDAVLRGGANVLQYQTLLIRKAVGSSSYAFANSFNHSLLTKRITMMIKSKSNPWMRTKGLYIIPVAVIALSAFATPELNNTVNNLVAQKAVSDSKVTENSSNDQTFLKETVSLTEETEGTAQENPTKAETLEVSDIVTPDNQVYDVVEEMPEFPDGIPGLMAYLGNKVRYPVMAQENGIQGKVSVNFIVRKDGKVSDVVAESIDGQPLNSRTRVPDGLIDNYIQKQEANGKTMSDEDRQALVIAYAMLTQEAENVIKSMPDWTPGKQNGEVVNVKFSIPISFKLQ